MKEMLLAKIKWAMALVLGVGVLLGGTVALSYRIRAAQQPQVHRKARTSPSNQRIPTIEVWQERAVLKDNGNLFYSVAFSGDGKRLAAAGSEGAVLFWETANPRRKTTIRCREGRVLSVAFSPDGKTLASGQEGAATLWNAATAKERASWRLPQSIVSLAFSPDGKSLAMGYGSGNIALWDVAAGKERMALEGSRRNGGGGPGLLAMSVAFSPDGKLLANGRFDHTIKLWDAATGKERFRLEGHNRPVFCVSFAPDGKTLASGSSDGTVRLWDIATGKEKAVLLREARWLLCVAFSPDGRTVAAGFRPKGESVYQVKLWDVKSGKERAILKGYGDEGIISMAFSPDGKLLATACGDFYSGRFEEDRKNKGEVRLWELVRKPAKK